MADRVRTAQVLTVLNLKGGVGKTHTSWVLASVAQEREKRILLVDLDTQGNLSRSFLDTVSLRESVAMLFDPSAESDVLSLVQRTTFSHIDILPSTAALAPFDESDQREWEKTDGHLSLLGPVESLRRHYDFIVFDCPPRLSLVSFAALCASDHVIVPLEAADWGAQGVQQVTDAVKYVRERFNARLNLLGYLISRFKGSRTYQRTYSAGLRSHFGDSMFDTMLTDLADFEKSVTDRIPITLLAKDSKAAQVARKLFDEVCRRIAARAQAQQALKRVLAHRSELALGNDALPTPGEQRGRERLKGAFLIDIERIRPDPDQPRRTLQDESLQELAASIRRLGVVQAISVRYIAADDMYQIISGERRYQASKLAELPSIPCIVSNPEEDQILVRQIVENWQRAQLHPFEIADALAQLRDDKGYTQKKLAEETGKPEPEISKFLKLLDLDPAVQKDARADTTGTLSFRHLYNVARLESTEQAAIVSAVREQRLTATDTEKLVRKTIERRATTPKRGAPVTRVQYVTAKAKVVLTFRKQNVEPADIIAALDEARDKATPVKDRLNIERRK